MINRFDIIGHDGPRPDAERIVYCDGAGGSIFRPETDLELSHWRPNRTPREYRAGTSTEICFFFLDDPIAADWSVAVNNHLDVDGLLSVYALIYSEHALANRQAIIEAAEMGDFWSWGEPPAQRLFQGLTRLMNEARAKRKDTKAIYEDAFEHVPALLARSHADSTAIEESLAPLRLGVELVETGRIERTLVSPRFAQYVIPAAVAKEFERSAAYTPEFNEIISQKALLWPQVRARWDRERMCLVSTESSGGWLQELWFPGYLWADTEGRWNVPGLSYGDLMESYRLDNPRLFAALENLSAEESQTGVWAHGGEASPLARVIQDRFPLAARFANESGEPAESSASPARVADCLAPTFA